MLGSITLSGAITLQKWEGLKISKTVVWIEIGQQPKINGTS